MARIYGNENVPLPVVISLRLLGHDVLTTLEAGRANRSIPDEEVLSHALQIDRVVVTNNRVDFRRLHDSGADHRGIITFTADIDFDGLAHRIHQALTSPESVGRFYATVTRHGHSHR